MKSGIKLCNIITNSQLVISNISFSCSSHSNSLGLSDIEVCQMLNIVSVATSGTRGQIPLFGPRPAETCAKPMRKFYQLEIGDWQYVVI